MAEAGADLIDLNMGCPVPKVCKTGAGAALLKDPDTAVAVARAAREGSGLPVTVKLRAEGVEVARRLVEEAGVAGITFHPRTVAVRHKGRARLRPRRAPRGRAPGAGDRLRRDGRRRATSAGRSSTRARRRSCSRAAALGNPWLFEQVLGTRSGEPAAEEILAEWSWVVDRAEEHLGAERAARYLRKFHPWYVERLGAPHQAQDALQRAATLAEARVADRAARRALRRGGLTATATRGAATRPGGQRRREVSVATVVLPPPATVSRNRWSPRFRRSEPKRSR